MLGLSAQETMELSPGLIFDLLELANRSGKEE